MTFLRKKGPRSGVGPEMEKAAKKGFASHVAICVIAKKMLVDVVTISAVKEKAVPAAKSLEWLVSQILLLVVRAKAEEENKLDLQRNFLPVAGFN